MTSQEQIELNLLIDALEANGFKCVVKKWFKRITVLYTDIFDKRNLSWEITFEVPTLKQYAVDNGYGKLSKKAALKLLAVKLSNLLLEQQGVFH